MVQISASLLAADYARLGEEVRRAEAAGVDSFHFDLMDGHYVPNLALSPDHLNSLRRHTGLPFHAHLELANPDEVLDRFLPFAADVIIVQWDTLKQPAETFEKICRRRARVGLGLSPDDTLESVIPLLPDLDLLLILGVYPGFGGQAMQPGTVEKIRAARTMAEKQKLALSIAVDGGVQPANAPVLAQAGADCLIMGTALFQSGNMNRVVTEIRGSAAASPRR